MDRLDAMRVILAVVDAAETLAARAHEICPYSKATRGNIGVEINVV